MTWATPFSWSAEARISLIEPLLPSANTAIGTSRSQ